MPKPLSRISILHIVYSHFPADSRVRRETTAIGVLGRRIAVLALRGPQERRVERFRDTIVIRLDGSKKRGGILRYIIEYCVFTFRCRMVVARARALTRVDLVHVHTLPDFLVLAALPAKRRGARLVFDMHEIFPEFSRSKFRGIVGRVLAHLTTRIERWARTQADLTIVVNRPIEALLQTRSLARPRPEARLVLHNTADPTDFGLPGRPRGALNVPMRLVYHGTFTRLYGLDVAIKGVALARQRGIDVDLTLIGSGPDKVHLATLGAQLMSGHFEIVSPISQDKLPAVLSRYDAGLVPTRCDEMTRYSLSAKLLEYAHLAMPILATDLPSYQAYFPRPALWYWRAGDTESLATVIAAFAKSSVAERQHRAHAAQQAIGKFEWRAESESLRSAYRDLLSTAR